MNRAFAPARKVNPFRYGQPLMLPQSDQAIFRLSFHLYLLSLSPTRWHASCRAIPMPRWILSPLAHPLLCKQALVHPPPFLLWQGVCFASTFCANLAPMFTPCVHAHSLSLLLPALLSKSTPPRSPHFEVSLLSIRPLFKSHHFQKPFHTPQNKPILPSLWGKTSLARFAEEG
jgi:hypothetical protein